MVHSGIDKNPTKWPSDGGGVLVARIDCHCISSSYWPPEEAKGKQVKGQYMSFQNTWDSFESMFSNAQSPCPVLK